MRILRVAQKVYPDVTGGGPYHVHAMSRDQAAMGHNVTVLTVGDEFGREERDGYTVLKRPSRASVLGNDIAPGVWRELRAIDDYDVVHAHSHLYFSTNLAALRGRLSETPLALTNHGVYSQTAPEWIFDAYLKTIGRLTFNSADVVFCYTAADRQRLRERGVDVPIDVIPNGIDTDRFTPDGPDSELIDAPCPVLLFVGRLVGGKRPRIAVEALSKVLETHPNAELYLCGTGPLRKDLEELIDDLGIESAVTFLGHVSYDAMPRVYRSADVMMLPSRAEGVPRTVLEAKASGVPVVVSDLPQVRGVVGEGDQTVAGDASEFAAAIKRTLTADNLDVREHMDEHRWSDTVALTTTALENICR